MNEKIKDVEQGFALLKYALIVSILLGFILSLVIDENTTNASNINSLPQLLRVILFILGSYKLKDISESFKKFHTLALITTFPTIVTSVLGINIINLDSFFSNALNNADEMNSAITLIVVGFVVSIVFIVMEVFMYKRLTEGVKAWVKASSDPKYSFIETLSSQYYKRELTLNVYLPIGMFIGMMVFMGSQNALAYFVLILTLVIYFYSILHLIKSYTFFNICEKSAAGIMNGSNMGTNLE